MRHVLRIAVVWAVALLLSIGAIHVIRGLAIPVDLRFWILSTLLLTATIPGYYFFVVRPVFVKYRFGWNLLGASVLAIATTCAIPYLLWLGAALIFGE
jgi:hypothetical protein